MVLAVQAIKHHGKLSLRTLKKSDVKLCSGEWRRMPLIYSGKIPDCDRVRITILKANFGSHL